jgi:mono/diheme cytochrome c family protein
MRRTAATAALVAALAVVAGCGYEGETTASPETVVGTVPQPTETAPPVEVPEGDAAAGKAVFTTNCGGCHTMADAGTSGTVGPNLDETQPDAALVYDRVTNGKPPGMPAFEGSLSETEIADVTAYVSTAAGC